MKTRIFQNKQTTYFTLQSKPLLKDEKLISAGYTIYNVGM